MTPIETESGTMLVRDVQGIVREIPLGFDVKSPDEFLRKMALAGFPHATQTMTELKDFMDEKGVPAVGRTPEAVKDFLEGL